MVSDEDVRRQAGAQGLTPEQTVEAIKAANEDPKLTAVEAIAKAMKAQNKETSTTTTTKSK